MLDVIVIGREGFKSTDKPQVIYCGDSRSEAKKVALAQGDKFAWIYQVNGMITQNYKTRHSKPATAPAAEQAPEPPQPKRSKKTL